MTDAAALLKLVDRANTAAQFLDVAVATARRRNVTAAELVAGRPEGSINTGVVEAILAEVDAALATDATAVSMTTDCELVPLADIAAKLRAGLAAAAPYKKATP